MKIQCNKCDRWLDSSIDSVPFHDCYPLPFNNMITAPRCVQCHSECPNGLKKYPELIVCHNPECPNYGLCQIWENAINEINKMAI